MTTSLRITLKNFFLQDLACLQTVVKPAAAAAVAAAIVAEEP